jgi:uncharacterized DUF497 family protein
MNNEWDPAKNLGNIRKHSVSFEQAKIALEDPCRQYFYDEAHSLVEDRFIVIGNAEKRTLFVNIVWVNEDTTRIISARCANRNEMEAYNENRSLFFGKRTQTN